MGAGFLHRGGLSRRDFLKSAGAGALGALGAAAFGRAAAAGEGAGQNPEVVKRIEEVLGAARADSPLPAWSVRPAAKKGKAAAK